METNVAIEALAALAQATRLEVFRLLLRHGPNGLPAGEIAAALEVPPATLSFHLKQLEQAGLLTSRRDSRLIYYAADIEGVRRLLSFLTEDCCRGRPEICGDLAAGLADCGAAPPRPRRRRNPRATQIAGDTGRTRRAGVQCRVPLHGQFGPQHHGRMHPERSRPRVVPRL